jgi:hypothetical protein
MSKLLLSPLVLLAINAFAQSTPPPMPKPQPPPEQPDYIVPVQMGTATLINGKDTVFLDTKTLAEMKRGMATLPFTVVLTPKGDCGQLNLFETKDKYFIVKLQKGATTTNGKFDYVVFASQKRPLMAPPPMPRQPPMGMGQPGSDQQQPPMQQQGMGQQGGQQPAPMPMQQGMGQQQQQGAGQQQQAPPPSPMQQGPGQQQGGGQQQQAPPPMPAPQQPN